MNRDLSKLASKEYDLLIIGGGIFGVSAAWDAASRGLSVALVEKKDFCHASSANHLRMIHGGIRYLQHADIFRVRESSRARSELLHIAPHLVHPLPIIVPTYGHGLKGKELFWMGMSLYDLLTLDRNLRLQDPVRQIPRGRIISRQEILRLFPGLQKKGLTGGAVFHDGQVYSPQRLGISFLRSAVNAGCDASNYLKVAKLIRGDHRVSGALVRDELTGDEFEIRSKIVLNAASGWAHRLLEGGLGVRLDPMPTFSRDLGFIVSRALTDQYGFACQIETKDADAVFGRGGRHIFVVPWQEHTLVGVWHSVFNDPQDEIAVTEGELQGFIDEVNDAFPRFDLSLDDVSMILTGLTLFGKEGKTDAQSMSFGKRSLIIDHEKADHIEGLVTLIGVRATTARVVAEKTVDLVLGKLRMRGPSSRTSVVPIHGGQIDYFEDFLCQALKQSPRGLEPPLIRALVRKYGSTYPQVIGYANEDPEWIKPVGDSNVLKAEIIHAVREEMAQTLEDVVLRRTDLGVCGNPGEKALKTCAGLIGKELGWSSSRVREEIEETKTILQKRGFLSTA